MAAWQQEQAAAGHIVCTVRKQEEMDAGSQIVQSWTPAHGMVLLRVMEGLPTSI